MRIYDYRYYNIYNINTPKTLLLLIIWKFKTYAYEIWWKCEKQIFVLTSFWSIIKSLVYYHQISLAYAMPKRTCCHKRIYSRLGSKIIFNKTYWNLDLGMEKMCIWKRWAIPFFTDLPEFGSVDGTILCG